MVTKLPLTEAAWEIGPQVVADRRYLHQHPELGMQEENTARFVAEKLRELGIETTTGIANTGVLGLLHGDQPGKTVLLRADMDALPIDELNDVPYKSQNPGVMHACGHDSHTAMLLGVARLLVGAERGDQWDGQVRLPARRGVGRWGRADDRRRGDEESERRCRLRRPHRAGSAGRDDRRLRRADERRRR